MEIDYIDYIDYIGWILIFIWVCFATYIIFDEDNWDDR
jgi:hypothetical protein